MNVTPSRIPRVIDNGPANDWIEYADEPWGFVHIGDVVDMYLDVLDGDVFDGDKCKWSGKIIGVEYASSGELFTMCLVDENAGIFHVGYTGAIYHHKEDER